jgi:hypothetical protein
MRCLIWQVGLVEAGDGSDETVAVCTQEPYNEHLGCSLYGSCAYERRGAPADFLVEADNGEDGGGDEMAGGRWGGLR